MPKLSSAAATDSVGRQVEEISAELRNRPNSGHLKSSKFDGWYVDQITPTEVRKKPPDLLRSFLAYRTRDHGQVASKLQIAAPSIKLRSDQIDKQGHGSSQMADQI